MSGSAPWRLSDLLWEHLTEAGRDVFDTGKHEEAGALWRAAVELAQGFGSDDPRRAAGLHNQAAAARSVGDAREAEALYREALAAWDLSPRWVERMDPGQRARSSLFHLRLEQKYRDWYRALALKEAQRLADAGRGATLNNLGELFHGAGKAKEAEDLYREALKAREGALGPRDEGLVVILNNLRGALAETGSHEEVPALSARIQRLAAAAPSSPRARWARERGAGFTDLRKLLAAALLTPLVSHPGPGGGDVRAPAPSAAPDTP